MQTARGKGDPQGRKAKVRSIHLAPTIAGALANGFSLFSLRTRTRRFWSMSHRDRGFSWNTWIPLSAAYVQLANMSQRIRSAGTEICWQLCSWTPSRERIFWQGLLGTP